MDDQKSNADERRDFIKKCSAVALGGLAATVPLVAGLGVIFDPLQRKSQKHVSARVTNLAALPADGIPRKFSIIASRTDAWNRFSAVPVGAIYLRRTADNVVEAINVACPHAGCAVDFISETNSYLCPCHNSTFAIDGKINDPRSPSPRALDRLKVEISGNEVWVQFQNFRAGETEQIAEA
jgi:Rieske Fe-S protein